MAGVFDQIAGPVLAVGHSYGGAVISNAATDAKNVVGLVFVAAFAPDEGERLGEVTARSKDSVLGTALVPRQYPTGDGGTATEFFIDPAKARDGVRGRPARGAGRVDRRHPATGGRARVQRAVRAAGVEEPAVVGRRRDRRQGGRRRRRPVAWPSAPAPQITEVEGSHVIMVSQPQAVDRRDREAVAEAATGQRGGSPP